MATPFGGGPFFWGVTCFLSDRGPGSASASASSRIAPAPIRLSRVPPRYQRPLGYGADEEPTRAGPTGLDPTQLAAPLSQRRHVARAQLRIGLAEAKAG